MPYRYAVLGAGRQGVAAAYDLAKFGSAERIVLADLDLRVATTGAEHINHLLGGRPVEPVQCDVSIHRQLDTVLKGVNCIVSAVPYRYNLPLTDAAIRIHSSLVDMGGHTGIVRDQLGRDVAAREAGVTIVPDCGMGPGLNISLATRAMALLDKPRAVYIWDGGLPQKPVPPWNYEMLFSTGGLTNEYSGNAFFLRGGKVVEVPCFEGYEEVDFPPLGKLEAFVTSGGLSTAPWTFAGALDRLENRTLRYPGHWQQFRAFAQLGLLGEDPLRIGGTSITPRAVFHALLERQLVRAEVHDVAAMRVRCEGEKDGKPAAAVIELVDYYDPKTGFSAMQRLTGWHTSIMAILAAQGKIARGAVSVERAVPGAVIVEECRRRGIAVSERVQEDR